MRKIHALMLILGVGSAGLAESATTLTTFAVTATVQPTCAASAIAMPFGIYTPGAGARTVNGSVSVRCTKNTPFTVALNGGATGTVAQRLMANGANTLQYNLYTAADYAKVFGDGSGTSLTQAGTGTGVLTPTAFTVYGQLLDSAANQAALPGNYTDTVTVTVTY